MTIIKKTSATGLKGMLLDDGRTFRVTYGKPAVEGDPWYQDYDMYHPDLTITITDTDAFLYEDDLGNFYVDMDNRIELQMLAEKKAKGDEE